MDHSNLARLGWDEFFDNHFRTYASNGFIAGRVTLEYNHLYRVNIGAEEVVAEITGKLRYDAADQGDLPVVGDWVAIRSGPESGKATIHDVLPRKTKFTRKVAGTRTAKQVVGSNIDTVFLVTSLNEDFNLRRVERYLIVAWESGARPVIVLSKADVCADIGQHVEEMKSIVGDAPIHVVSVVTREGLDELTRYFKHGKTVALLGSSGVGKSSLINHLLGCEYLKVRETRARDGRGQHTTTHRELITLPQGGLVLDTPGMRELQLWDGDAGLQIAFADIETVAGNCYFSDCQHQGEPHCAISEALTDGSIDESRYESYLKLGKELDYLARKQDVGSAIAEKKKWKRLSRMASERARMKRKGG